MKPIRNTSEFKVGDTLRRVRKNPVANAWDNECLVEVIKITGEISFNRKYLEGPQAGMVGLGNLNFGFDYFHHNEEPEELWV